MSPRVGTALLAGTSGAVLVYAAMRLVETLVRAEPDPAAVLYSAHAGFFWRAWTSVYVGGMIAIVTWLVAGTRERAAARFAGALAIGSASGLAVVAVVAP